MRLIPDLVEIRLPGLLTCLILEQLVLERVDQGQPARLDDVLADADRAPDVVAVAPLDHDAHPGGRPGPGVDDAHLVIDQLHLRQARVERLQRLAQRAVEGVHRAVAFADRVHHLRRRRGP